jgi:hypothetical protein
LRGVAADVLDGRNHSKIGAIGEDMTPSVLKSFRIASNVLAATFLLYCIGFYAVMLGVRSDDDQFREAALNVETHFYYPLLASSSHEKSLIRRLYLHRVTLMCKGHEHRCRVVATAFL